MAINMMIENPEADPGGYFLGTLFGDPELLSIWDTSGRILWAVRQYDETHGGIDSRIHTDGNSILFNRFSKNKEIDDGAIHHIALDGSPLNQSATPKGHHVFTQLPDSTLIYIKLDERETEEHGLVCGDALIKLHQDGSMETIFSVWDHMTVSETRFFYNSFYPQCKDWTHGNFIDYDANRDSLIFSTAGADVIFELTTNGDVIRIIGGQPELPSDYELHPPGASFGYPHGVIGPKMVI